MSFIHSKKARLVAKALLVVFSFIILFFLLRKSGFDKIAHAFSMIGFGGSAALLALGFFENFLDATALKYATANKISVIKVWSLNAAGTLTNSIIPWEGGEFLKTAIMSRYIPASEAISSIVVWNYVFKISRMFAFLFILLIAFIFDRSHELRQFGIVLLALLVSSISIPLMFIIIKMEFSQKIVKLLAFFGKKNVSSVMEKAKRLDKRMKDFRSIHKREYRMIVAYQFAARFVSWLTFYLITVIVHLDVTFGKASLLYCAIFLGGHILSFIPVKVGLSEGVGFVVFSFFGLDGGMGVIITLVWRIKALITTAVASSFTLFVKEKSNEDA